MCLRKPLQTKVFNEVIDALGDIPAEDATEQQKQVYRLCVEIRDEIIKGEEHEKHIE